MTDMVYAPCEHGGKDACFDGQSHSFIAGDGNLAIAMCDARPLGTVADITEWKAKAEAFDKATHTVVLKGVSFTFLTTGHLTEGRYKLVPEIGDTDE